MEDARVNRLFSLARAGRMSRRQLLETGLRLGLASPVIISLIEAAPRSAAAAPSPPAVRLDANAAQEGSSGTLTGLVDVRHGGYRSALHLLRARLGGRADGL